MIIMESRNSKLISINDRRFSMSSQATGQEMEFFQIKEIIHKEKDANLIEVVNQIDRNLKSVVLIIDKKYIHELINGDMQIESKPLKSRKVSHNYRIDPNIPYGNQQSAKSIGTGFFIADNIIATAAHVVVGPHVKNIHDIRIVHSVYFKNAMDYNGKITVSKSQIFQVDDVVTDGKSALDMKYYYLSRTGPDWAVLKVKPAYATTTSQNIEAVNIPADLEVYTQAFLNKSIIGKGAYSIGHGLGLPAKISYVGEISWIGPQTPYFECSLTLLGGSSGAPVFDVETHQLIGMYIRGTKKLILSDTLTKEKMLSIKSEQVLSMEGQECQRIEHIVMAIKPL